MYRKVILAMVAVSLGFTATLIWWMGAPDLGHMRLPFLTGAVEWLLVGDADAHLVAAGG